MKSTLLALANHADDTDACFPSVPRIALFAGTTDRGARLALRALEEAGLVRTVHATGSRSNYELAVGTMTPEHSSSPKPRAPRNHVPPTPELGSSPPRNDVPQPRNLVPPNLQEPSVQPSGNPQVEARDHASLGAPFSLEAPPPPATASPQPKPTRSVRQRHQTQINPAWQPDAAGIAFAAGKGITDVAAEAKRFVCHHQAKGSVMVDWSAAWRTWSLNNARFRNERAANGTVFAGPSASTPNSGGLIGAVARMYQSQESKS